MSWQGDPFHVVYSNLKQFSSTFRAFESQWHAQWFEKTRCTGTSSTAACGPRRMVPRDVTHHISNELKQVVAEALLESGRLGRSIELSLVVQQPPVRDLNQHSIPQRWVAGRENGPNFLHVVAVRRAAGVLKVGKNELLLLSAADGCVAQCRSTYRACLSLVSQGALERVGDFTAACSELQERHGISVSRGAVVLKALGVRCWEC